MLKSIGWHSLTKGMRCAIAGSHLFTLVVLFYLAIITFPGQYLALNPANFDDGWIWALNALANSNFLFGHDVVFSYGPLGYLLFPRNIGANFTYATIFMMTMYALWLGVLVAYFRIIACKSQIALFVLTYSVAYAFGTSLGISFAGDCFVGLLLTQ